MLITPLTALAPQRVPPGTANDLDPINVFQHHVLHVPIHAREIRIINGAAVDHHQHLVPEGPVEAARTDGPGVRVRLCNVQPRRHPQGVGNVCNAAAADHLIGNHEHGGRGMSHRALFLGDRSHGEVHQCASRGRTDRRLGELLDVEIEDVFGIAPLLCRPERPPEPASRFAQPETRPLSQQTGCRQELRLRAIDGPMVPPGATSWSLCLPARETICPSLAAPGRPLPSPPNRLGKTLRLPTNKKVAPPLKSLGSHQTTLPTKSVYGEFSA